MTVQIKTFDQPLVHRVDEITNVVRAAYQALVRSGMTASATQTDGVTLMRLNQGPSFIAFDADEIVGTITLLTSGTTDPIAYFNRPNVAFFTQFAVKPGAQGQGVGLRLLNHLESIARLAFAREVALDTSGEAKDLIAWYQRRGYRFVESCRLLGTTYQSVVLAKRL